MKTLTSRAVYALLQHYLEDYFYDESGGTMRALRSDLTIEMREHAGDKVRGDSPPRESAR